MISCKKAKKPLLHNQKDVCVCGGGGQNTCCPFKLKSRECSVSLFTVRSTPMHGLYKVAQKVIHYQMINK